MSCPCDLCEAKKDPNKHEMSCQTVMQGGTAERQDSVWRAAGSWLEVQVRAGFSLVRDTPETRSLTAAALSFLICNPG